MILGPKEMEAAGPVLDKLKQEMERLEAQKNSHPYRLNSARLEDAIPMPDDPEERWDEWKAAQAAYNAARPADLIAIESDYLAAYKAYKSAYKSYVMKMYSEVPKDPESIIEFAKIQTRLYADSEYRRMPAEYKGTELYRMFNFEDGEFRLDKMYIFLYVNSGLSPMIREYPDLEDDIQQAIIQTINELPYVGTFMAVDNLIGNKSIPSAKVTPPKEYVWATDKAATAPFDYPQIFEVEAARIDTGSKQKKFPGPLLSINQTDSRALANIKGLTRFDQVVHDAANTLFVAGNECITPIMILKAICADSDARPTREMQKMVCDSMDKLMCTFVTIDATGEIAAKNLGKTIYQGFIFQADKASTEIHGQNVDNCYRLLRKSILYEYSNDLNRIGRCSLPALRNPLEKNKESILLQDEVRRRVFAAKNPKAKISPIMKFDRLYELAGVKPDLPKNAALRKKKASIRKKVFIILDSFKKEGIIKGYEIIKDRQTIDSVCILY